MIGLLPACLLAIASTQGSPHAQAMIDQSLDGSVEALEASVRRHPDAARTATHDLLELSITEPGSADASVARADRIARAFAEVWTDNFLLRSVQIFERWSTEQRQEWLEATRLRTEGNAAYSGVGVTEAIGLWRESLRLMAALPDSSGMARALGNIGAGFYAAGEADSSAAYLARAYETAFLIGDFRTSANALTNLANLDYEHGHLSKAADQFSRALQIRERIGDQRGAAADQHNLGLVFMELGEVGLARSALETSIDLSRRLGHPDDEAESLSSLADLEVRAGDYGAADSLLDLALRLDRETGNRIGSAGALHSMGLVDLNRGDYRGARARLSEAHGIYSEMGHTPDAIEVRMDLATAYAAAGEIQAGLLELQQAQREAQAGSVGPLLEADLVQSAAELKLLLNQYAEAEKLFVRSAELYRSVNAVAGLVSAQIGQGYLLLVQEDFDQALPVLRRALEAQSIWDDSRDAALTSVYVAYAEKESGDTAQARETLMAARDRLQEVGDPVGYATVLSELGGLEAESGKPARADSLYRAGLVALAGHEAPDAEWRLRAARAELLSRRGDATAAADELAAAIELIERTAGALDRERWRSAFLADKWDVYGDLAVLEFRRDRLPQSYATSERMRGRAMAAMLDLGAVSIPGAESSALVAREQTLRRRISIATAQIEGHGAADAGLRGTASYAAPVDARTELVALNAAYADVLAELRASGSPYANLVSPLVPDLAAVANGLRPGQAFLEYMVTDSTTLVFVVTRDTAVGVELDMSRGQLEDLIGLSRAAIARRADGSDRGVWRAPLGRLHEFLIDPIESRGLLDGSESLLISPHGILHYLPFQALLRADDGEFLVQRYTVTYTPSASVWTELLIRRPAAGNQTVLALAPLVSELPASRSELKQIRELYGARAQTLAGDRASEAAFRTMASDFDVLHLATTGSVNKSNPLFSHVSLAPGPRADGRLEVHEVIGLELDARLVVLSACETALGAGSLVDVPPGDDWVGLVRAFLNAGAANVLASLWRVEDQATADLMTRFYRYLSSGMTTSEALARAQRDLIRQPETAHPFYWAAFELTGEGQ